MKKNLVCLFIAALLILSCSDEAIRKPSGLVKRNLMVNILVDIHLSDAAFQTRRYTSEEMRNYTESDFYYSVLKKHNVADSVFEISVIYYSGKPKEFEKIYTRVVNRLTQMEQEELSKNQQPVKLDNIKTE